MSSACICSGSESRLFFMRRQATLFSRPCSTTPSVRARWCVHLGGMAFFFHFVSAVEMLVQAHRWVPVGAREVESLLGVCGSRAVLSRVVDLRRNLAWSFCTARHFLPGVCAFSGHRMATCSPSQGVRTSWLVAHITALCWPRMPRWDSACLLRCFTWCRNADSKPSPSPLTTPGGCPWTGCLRWIRWSGSRMPCCCSVSRA